MLTNTFSRRVLSEALALSFVENTLHKTNYLSLYFRLPLNEETAASAAVLSHLITNTSEKYPDMQGMRRARANLFGADIAAATTSVGETLLLTITAAFLKDRYAPEKTPILREVLSFIQEFFCRPRLIDGAFDPELVALEAKNAADDARAVLNDKGRLARRRHIEAMFSTEPFSTNPLGRPEKIEALCAPALTESFYHMLRTAPVEAIFVGEAEEEELLETLSRTFAPVQESPLIPPPSSVVAAPDTPRILTEKMDINQAHLCLGLRTEITRNHPDYFAFSVGNTVFGSGITSKLFMTVREKLSLCYSIASIYEAQKGFLQVYAGIDSDKRRSTSEQSLLLLADTQNAKISPEELQNAKNTLKNAVRTYTASPDIIAAWALPRILCGVDVNPDAEIAAIDAITAEEAARAMATLVPDTFYCLQKEGAQ